MRDSALKLVPLRFHVFDPRGVGEELMRDSALKLSPSTKSANSVASSEKSSCATAL